MSRGKRAPLDVLSCFGTDVCGPDVCGPDMCSHFLTPAFTGEAVG